MKTTNDLNRLIREAVEEIEYLRREDEMIWSVRGGAPEADAKRSKKLRRLIRNHRDEIARLRRLAVFVESTTPEAIETMLARVEGEVARITASAERYTLKSQKKEYLANAGIRIKLAQVKELKFLLQ